MHTDLNTVIAVVVGAHLIGAVAKTVFKTPKQQAQIDAIEAKLETILGQLTGNGLIGSAAAQSSNTQAGKDGG